MTAPNVLIVEDEYALSVALAAAVRQASAFGEVAPSAAQARRLLASRKHYDAMVLDIGLPDENGLKFLETLEAARRPPTIVITGHGEIQNTIAARKLGVRDFLTKPLNFAEFQDALLRLIEPRRRKPDLGKPVAKSVAFIGAAPAMRPVFQQIAHSCASDDPVLVRGETGTGKSHAARLIQSNSLRAGPAATLAAGPATTTDELIQALTEAKRGVLVLEEVSLLSAEVQAELVRQIEAGAEEEFPRLIATTRNDLRASVSDGAFRSDLFYRLQVLEVRLPPLRERREDVPALVSYFIGQLVPDRSLTISDAALSRLLAQEWPGNLRELRNSIAYALTVNTGAAAIEVSDLPPYLGNEAAAGSGSDDEVPARLLQALDSWLDARFGGEEAPQYRELAETLEAALIRRLLRRYDGKLARMASALQANRTTLRRKLQG